jgi:hypothetical protein
MTMSSKKKKRRKERLKPLAFYGHDPKDVIRAFKQIDPEELKRLEGEEQIQWEKDSNAKKEIVDTSFIPRTLPSIWSTLV